MEHVLNFIFTDYYKNELLIYIINRYGEPLKYNVVFYPSRVLILKSELFYIFFLYIIMFIFEDKQATLPIIFFHLI
jgi:hypothetical protein